LLSKIARGPTELKGLNSLTRKLGPTIALLVEKGVMRPFGTLTHIPEP